MDSLKGLEEEVQRNFTALKAPFSTDDENWQWWMDNKDAYIRLLPEKYVGIANKAVVVIADDCMQVRNILEGKGLTSNQYLISMCSEFDLKRVQEIFDRHDFQAALQESRRLERAREQR